ncbi:MAG: sigma-54 dependent transcriptional regulator [Sandaracinaceae bacterium]
MATILVIEDEEMLRRMMERHLGRRGYDVVTAADCAEAKELVEERPFDIVLTDVRLPDGEGFELVDEARRQNPAVAVVVMTGGELLDRAVTAVRRGAADFLAKPFSLEQLDAALERIRGVAKVAAASTPIDEEDLDAWREAVCPELISVDPAMRQVFDIVRRVADTDCSVLVTGETGTGKELVAQAIHRASERREQAMIAVNCASIPENLMESELFGHSKGAFTGATNNYKGRFAMADRGTLLLDEIGEMPAQLQAKLLRVLQEGEVRPIGETRAQKIDVRVIAATHRDVDRMSSEGDFREDLLYRLDVIRIELPPLRQRPLDIPVLVEHFIRTAGARRGGKVTGIDQDAMDALVRFEWPGNVRQLRHTIERMVILSRGPILGLGDVPPSIRAATPAQSNVAGPVLPVDGVFLKDAVEEFENALILQALERTGWNKNQAASMLHMNRTTLVEKLKKKGLADVGT